MYVKSFGKINDLASPPSLPPSSLVCYLRFVILNTDKLFMRVKFLTVMYWVSVCLSLA